ncbi:hypothetical protein ACTLPN_000295 [Pseudomonas aeruginosa]
MNDRELLELAARAAGIKARWFREYCAIYWDKLGEMAATRLAITEAAAEIGKSMGGGE